MSTEKIMEQPVNVRLLEALKGLMALSDHRVDLRDQAKAARSAIAAAEAREMRDEYRSASCDDVARRVDECMTLRAERDALAAKLAELEGQEPTAWMNAKRDMASFIHFHEDDLPLFARPVPVEPVNVDFGMRGESMFFNIGNQSFLLDYKPEEQDEFDFMKAMLLSAFSRITHGVKTESQPVNARLVEALHSIRQYGLDTLSGRADGGDDDYAWQRAAVNEMTKRARIALALAAEAQQAEPVRPKVSFIPSVENMPMARSIDDEMMDLVDRLGALEPVDPRAWKHLLVYAPKTDPVRLTRVDIAKAFASAGLKPEDYREDGEILPLVIAIESAALRKNGIEAAE